MLKRRDLVEAFEKGQMRRARPDYHHSLRILEAMYRESVALGVLPLKDPLDGIEVDIRLAKVINVRATAGTPRTQAG
ncbi:MAG: hypothetical protein ACC700_20900 [Anaerolineales bacterium]